MNAIINPSKIKGELKAPPSKSMAHRYLICAGLAEGKSVVSGIDFSQDVLATLDCLNELGVDYEIQDDKITFNGKGIVTDKKEYHLKCRESGSTIRFFIPISMMTKGKNVFYGSDTLINKRPFTIYEDICREKRIRFENNGKNIIVEGNLTSGEYSLRGDVSSQFITGLMFTLPLLDGDSRIKLTTKVESRSYINLTIQALSKFGVETKWEDDQTVFIKGNQTYKPCDITVEGDYSNAACIDAYNLTGGELEITGLDPDSKQGDKIYRNHFEALKSENAVCDLSDCPDLGPILFAVAAANQGGYFTGTERLKIKESDRGTVMCEELAKFGIETQMTENSITIKKGVLQSPKAAVSGHNDHRIVMAMALLLSITGGVLEGCEAVRKSFPSYFDDMKKVGLEVEVK